MPNGKIGDHPLTDILVHGKPVYGAEADDLIHKIAALSSHRELHEWWDREIGWRATAVDALSKARVQHGALIARAKANGWELPEGAA
jgi:hypothetical protein